MPKIRLFDFENVYDTAQRWFFVPLIACIFVLLTAWSIDSLRPELKYIGFKDLDVPAVVGITLAATMFVLLAFDHQLKSVSKQLGAFSPSLTSKIIPNGIQDVYGELGRAIREVGPGGSSERTLEILGLTLFTAWPIFLQPTLCNDPQALRGWRITLFLLEPNYIASSPFLSKEWVLDSNAQSAAIREFAVKKAQLLKSLNIEFHIVQYKSFPAVHGFRTNAGHLFISYIHWDGDLLDRPTQFYEIFQPSDVSLRAGSYRMLFHNWVTHARDSGMEMGLQRQLSDMGAHTEVAENQPGADDRLVS